MGTCHAACLEGSTVVDLETGEPSEGPVSTFKYAEDDAVPVQEHVDRIHIPNSAASAIFVLHHHCRRTGVAEISGWIRNLLDQPDPLAPDIVAFIRKLGRERVSADVVIEQFKILGRRGAGEIEPLERLMMKTFVTMLLDLDDFHREEAARRASTPPPAPFKVPIEDTTLELVDGVFDTH